MSVRWILTLAFATLGLVVASLAIVGLDAQERAAEGPLVEVYKSPT